MPRVYKPKPDALRGKLTVPMSENLLQRLRDVAIERQQTPTSVARELIEQNLPVAVAK